MFKIILMIIIVLVKLDHGYRIFLNDKQENAIKFWIDAMCNTRATKFVHLLGILTNDSSSSLYLNLFLNGLVSGINQNKCETTIYLNRYDIDDPRKENNSNRQNDNIDLLSLEKISSKNSLGTNSLKVLNDLGNKKRKRKRRSRGERTGEEGGGRRKDNFTKTRTKNNFNLWSLHVILIKDERSMERILNGKESAHWMSRLHFIVLIISDDGSIQDNKFEVTIERTLKMFWLRRQILNVLVFLPFSENDKNFTYAYNPFVLNNDTNVISERGKLESINVLSKEDIFQCLSTLTHRRTNNLYGYKLNVGLFQQYQTLMKTKQEPLKGSVYEYSLGYRGTNAMIMGTIVKYMNFTVNEINPEDRIKFGHELPNGTLVGTLGIWFLSGDIVYGRADVTFASFFVKPYSKNKHNFEFTSQTGYDSICVFVPKARKIPKWLRIHHMFEPSIWFCSIISPIIVYLMCYVLLLFTSQRTKVFDRIKLAYKVFQFTVGFPTKLPRSCPERILLSTLSITNVTIAGLFGGLLYKSLTNDIYYKDINSLSELDASGLPIVFLKYNLIDVFSDEPTESPVLNNLRTKFKHGVRALHDASFFRNASGLIRKKHFYLTEQSLLNDDLSPKLHLVKECPRNYYLAYPIRKNSYLLEKIDLIIGRLHQAGLLTLWNNRTVMDLIYQRRNAPSRMQVHAGDKFVPFNLEDMQTSFYLLIVGLLLSSIVFCDEKGWLRRFVKDKKGKPFLNS
ncbi:hypothetical protein M0802_000123 [Mischocyttarus mexicanus]|nr:hypothetical protein M0802_000123 [Mischocyttarus mexicanus]